MTASLESLPITEQEVESLTGLDVDAVFVGGALTGVYRPMNRPSFQQRFHVFTTELILLLLVFTISVPLGLASTQQQASGIQTLGDVSRFLLVTSGLTLAIMVVRCFLMRRQKRRLRRLFRLLDAIDDYNGMLQALAVSEQLAIAQTQCAPSQTALEALRLTRHNLTCGLAIERILRENQGLLARQSELLANIESNLTNLRTLEPTQQAENYQQLLQQALQIGMSVQQALQKVVR